jgi:hypothetical protein
MISLGNTVALMRTVFSLFVRPNYLWEKGVGGINGELAE